MNVSVYLAAYTHTKTKAHIIDSLFGNSALKQVIHGLDFCFLMDRTCNRTNFLELRIVK